MDSGGEKEHRPMILTQPLTADDYKLIEAICQLAPTWTGGAEQFAHWALHKAGLSTGPTVKTALVEHATTFTQAALEARDRKPETSASVQSRGKPTPTAPACLTVPADPMQAGRLHKVLAHVYRFGTGVMSLGEFLESIEPTRRSEYVRRYARKKRNGYNKKLATPKHEYRVWYQDENGQEAGIDVPKVVYDALPADLPTRHTDEGVIEEPRRGSLVRLSPF